MISTTDFKKLLKTAKAVGPVTVHKNSPLILPEDAGGRSLKFVISTGAVDRDGDTIDQNGWDLTDYRKNPVVLWQHDRDQLPIGRVTDLVQSSDRLVATVEFVPFETPYVGDRAEAVYQLCKQGFLSATSVGFSPIDYEINDERSSGGFPAIDHRKQSLSELSIVNVPANPEALIVPAMDVPSVINAGAEVQIHKVKDRERIARVIKILRLR